MRGEKAKNIEFYIRDILYRFEGWVENLGSAQGLAFASSGLYVANVQVWTVSSTPSGPSECYP